jgi:imidazole glycerol phosphate synthase subunit HisF
MTPKEKAKELYKKYEFVYIQNYTSKHEVKQCVLIAVDEMIESMPTDYNVWKDNGANFVNAYTYYWTQVKQEIEKL